MSSRLIGAAAVAAACTSTALAGFVRFDLDLHAQPTIDGEEWDVYRLYARLTSSGDRFGIVAGLPGEPAVISTYGTGIFYQHFAGLDREHYALVEETFPDLVHDTYVTIGLTDAAEGGDYPTWLTPGWQGFEDDRLVLDNHAWFQSPDEAASLAGPDMRVLVGQFTISRGATLIGQNISVAGPGFIVEGVSFGSGSGGGEPDPGAPEPQTFRNQFGRTVTMIGDVDDDDIDDFAVAAPFYLNERGKVTIYSGATGLTLRAIVGRDPGDRFGWAMAPLHDVDGDDVHDFAVGVPHDDTFVGQNSGTLHVYSGATGDLVWVEFGDAPGDRLGYSVATGVDLDDDGVEDVIVGAPYNDDAAENAGRIYVLNSVTGDLVVRRKGHKAGDRFGWSCAGLPRLDGRDRFVVGAPYNDGQGADAGRVYLYNGVTFKLLERRSGRAGDRFGYDVANVGMINGDQTSDFVVGAPYRSKVGLPERGRIQVHSGQTARMLFSRSGPSESRFGFSVAGAGDVDGDSVGDIIVGAPFHDGAAGENSGMIRLISGATGGTILTATGEAPSDQYGRDVAALGDHDGDGEQEVLVGAPYAGPNDPGQVYLVPVSISAGAGATAIASPTGVQSDAGDQSTLTGLLVADRADVNADGVVDERDLDHVLSELGGPADLADVDGDGIVTGFDVAIVMDRFGATQGDLPAGLAPAPAEVPLRDLGDVRRIAERLAEWEPE